MEHLKEVIHRMLYRAHATSEEPIPDWDDIDVGKLESALAGPRQTWAGEDLYPTLSAKAAILLYGITKGHALPNGNKRMGLVTTQTFLAINGQWWEASVEEARAHVTWVAASHARLQQQVLAYLGPYIEQRLRTFVPPPPSSPLARAAARHREPVEGPGGDPNAAALTRPGPHPP